MIKFLKKLFKKGVTKEVFLVVILLMFFLTLFLVNWSSSRRFDQMEARNSKTLFEESILESSPPLELPDSQELLDEISQSNEELFEKNSTANEDLSNFLAKNTGNNVIAVFWADWDYNSINYLDELNGLSSNPNLATVAISQGEIEDSVLSHINQKNYDFKVIEDPMYQIELGEDVLVIPTTIFLDKNHNIFSMQEGVMRQRELEQKVIGR